MSTYIRHLDTPRLMNQSTGQFLAITDLTDPSVMCAVLSQLINEIWHAAPKDPGHDYRHYVPFDYAWHRITEHCLAELELQVHKSLSDMLDKQADLQALTVNALDIRK